MAEIGSKIKLENGKLYYLNDEGVLTELPLIYTDDELREEIQRLRSHFANWGRWEWEHYYTEPSIHIDIWLRQQYEHGRITYHQFMTFRNYSLREFTRLVRQTAIQRHLDPKFAGVADDTYVHNPKMMYDPLGHIDPYKI